MSITNIIVTSVDTAAMILDQLNPQSGASTPDSLDRASRWIQGLANSAFYFDTVVEQVGAVQAYGLITSTGTATNGDEMTVANVTLTAKTSGAVAANGEFNISGTVGTQATNIAAAINAVAGLSGIVTATSLAGVVTVTSVAAGVGGNGLELDLGTMHNMSVTAFAHGTNGTATTLA